MGTICTVQTQRNSLKFFLSETAAKKIGHGPLKNSGEQSRAIFAILFVPGAHPVQTDWVYLETQGNNNSLMSCENTAATIRDTSSKKLVSQERSPLADHNHDYTGISCELCTKILRNRDSMRKHMMIHNGIKPFTCNVCGKRFRQKHHMQGHFLLYHKNEFI